MTAITAAHIAIQNVIGRVKFMDAIPAPVNWFCCINLDANYYVGRLRKMSHAYGKGADLRYRACENVQRHANKIRARRELI
jgi:hypothetical protein